MIHGFLKACTVSPALRVADCAFNTQQTIAAMQRAAADGVQLAVFPELGLTAIPAATCFSSSRSSVPQQEGSPPCSRRARTLTSWPS